MKTAWFNNWKTWVALGALILFAFALGRATGGDSVDDESTVEEDVEEDDASEYTCPMHPQIRESEMGTCPICHMDLVPADEATDDDSGPSVEMSEQARRLARIQDEEVEVGPVVDELEVFGRVEVDEEREVDIAAWTGGRIERLEVSARGEEIRRGQLLARIYSPELYAAQRSLVQAVESRTNAEEAGSDRRVRAAQASIEAARTELRLLGVDPRQIDEVQESGNARETVDVFATASGTVQARHVRAGDYVDAGDEILSLAPLDSVWAQLDVYERDLQRISEGMPVDVKIPALDGDSRQGRIEFVSPQIDADRRVARARVVLANEDGALKPGMYVRGSVEIGMEGDDVVSVPRSAVLWTGDRSLVYVYDRELDPSGYVPQPVELGPRIGERYVVDSGLNPGDVVASRGAFRIDAELQISGGPTMMSTIHDEGAMPVDEQETVEIPDGGVEFDPPIEKEQLPRDRDFWYCDMGTVEWAQPEEGDGECPVCGMDLTHHDAEEHDGDHQHDDHDHDDDHQHDHDGGHDHAH